MKINSVKTHSIMAGHENIFEILDMYLKEFRENSVLAVTSKIVSICEGSVIPVGSITKDELVEKYSDYYLSKDFNKYGIHFTITRGTMIASAGIDESNGNGNFILWPKDPQQSANNIREYLAKRFHLKNVGVVITDSKTFPLRWGTHGTSLAHSGFKTLNSYIGSKDLFDYQMRVTQLNIAEGLAASAVLNMGEGAESTPLAIMEDLPFVRFQDRNPTKEELSSIKLSLEEDVYSPLLTKAPWKKGRSGK